MQISRHWRMNLQRYRLVGVRYENGSVSLQERPAPVDQPKAGSDVIQRESVGRETSVHAA